MAHMISREYWFSSAHRLEGHPKCGRLHGHNYKVIVVVSAELHDGMIMDFQELDSIVKPILDELDHRYIVSLENIKADDMYLPAARTFGHSVEIDVERSTAECLSKWLHKEIHDSLAFVLDTKKFLLTIMIWETHKSMAEYTK